MNLLIILTVIYLINSTKCDNHHLMKRYIYGTSTNISDWPGTVLIKRGNEKWKICTGTLITDNYVLTAAHCVTKDLDNKKEDLKIIIGIDDRSKITQNDVIRKVNKIKLYPKYESQNHSYDIALVELERPVKLYRRRYSYIKPVCLNLFRRSYNDAKCFGVGWGRNTPRNMPDKLQSLKMKISSLSQCASIHQEFYNHPPSYERVIHTHLCTVSADNPYPDNSLSYGAACAGDSGGPLYCKMDMKWFQVGVAWSNTDCIQNPSVYNRVDKYKHWILRESGYQLPSYCK